MSTLRIVRHAIGPRLTESIGNYSVTGSIPRAPIFFIAAFLFGAAFFVVNAAEALTLPLSVKSAKRMKATLIKDGLLKRKFRPLCKGKLLKSRSSACDADRDGLINLRETRLDTNPMSADSDGDFLKDRAELVKFLTDPRKADTDGNGVADGDEDVDHDGTANEDEDDKPAEGETTEDADDGQSSECAPPNFDADGNTSQFGIVSGIIGNVALGQDKYTARCAACHRGVDKGANYAFGRLKSAVEGAPMFIRDLSDGDLANLTAYLNRNNLGGSGECQTPVPTSIPEPPTPTVTPLPTLTPTPFGLNCSCIGAGFNTACSTSSFGIPTPLMGNMDVGQVTFNTCAGSCHTLRGQGFTYSQLQAAVTGPLMRINTVTNQQYADMVAYLNSAGVTKSCSGPTPTPTRTPTRTRTPTPSRTPTRTPVGYSCTCAGAGFDVSCNTTSFGIPTPLVGNMDIGQATFETCAGSCHTLRGQGFTYPQLQAAVTGPLMRITTVTNQQYADMAAYLNSAAVVKTCTGPTPSPTVTRTPTRTPTPTRSATPTPAGYSCSCSGSGFDSACNTTSFGIPTPLVGNIDAGSNYYGTSCSSCHSLRGQNFTYAQLQAAVTGPLMRINNVTNQQYADMAAFLNSSAVVKTCTGPTPSPTPTLSPVDRGRNIFLSSCAMSGCHSFDSNGSPRELDTHPSRSKIHNALRQGPDSMPQFLEFTLGPTAPPYSETEEALYQYLLTVP